ncbi:hypothetical protein GVY41_18320 [Frigidibacter albus]|uniref:Acyl-CoA dehydrogenase n=1 Tax=Frigidibacter albus TaxID=1465486 RepID=A0A6L8VLI4_9RHOB|nr:acyl-CoA dehydrogenase family protein [Frigidibacter albus]MZQ91073.1 hypothetical protein [Frigidibacter albus]NBE32958.1 hypothetical protein [Frigidibacter albus]GGH62661.1 hypothetical protein GCM10011341_37010 [Frigidibacter albus]
MFDKFITEDAREIVDTVARALQEALPLDRLSRPDGGLAAETGFWPELLALEWPGVDLPAAIGGSEAGAWTETGIFREFGRHLLSPGVLAVTLAASVAQEGGLPDLARDILKGQVSPALAVPLANGWAGVIGTGDLLLLAGEGGLSLHRTRPEELATAWAFDDTLGAARIRLDPATALTSLPPSAQSRLRLLRLVAAMQNGIAEATLTLSRDHAATRQQFGKPIGAFQAVKHLCADMAVRTAAAGALLGEAALDGADISDCAAAAMTASTAARDNASATIQIFGGMGFTAECPAQLYLKRATLLELVVGGKEGLQDEMLAA